MPKLVVLQGGEAVPYHVADEGDSVIGRHPDCQVQLNSNMVSRRHARVWQADSAWWIEDLGSGNGTFVNGAKVEEPLELKHNDRIKLGPILIRFESQDTARTAELPKADFEIGGIRGVDVENDSESVSATIMGRVENTSGFGRLEVRPEAKLKAVIEISRALAGTTQLESLLPRILDTLFNVFPHADRGCVLLKHEESGKMIPRAIKHRRPNDDESVKISRTILRTVLEQKTGILSADASNDSRFQASESISSLTIRSMMCVPLLGIDGEPMGVIHIDTQNSGQQFREEDLDLLMAVAGQAALSYESARLLVTAIEKQKQDREMGIAAGVQRALLPAELPQVPGYEFYASYDSAQAVGGDYYDCMTLEGSRRICFAFGDVAGKGVPASLVMSRLSAVVQNTMRIVNDVGKAIDLINDAMCAKAVEGRFVTFVLGVIDLAKNQLTLVNCGHMPPLVRRVDGSIEELAKDIVGVPLGVIEEFPYDTMTRTIEPGETIVIYTDGVSEAMNPQSALYGIERLQELIRTSTAGAAESLGKTILADVRRHADGRAQNDDITIMVFGRK